MPDRENYYGLAQQQLQEILDGIRNEIYVTDRNGKVIYISSSCSKHYGVTADEIIGKNNSELAGKLWKPSAATLAYSEKRRITIRQKTVNGSELISTANPVIDENGEIEMMVAVAQEDFGEMDLTWQGGSDPLIKRYEKTDEMDVLIDSKNMKQILDKLRRVASTDMNVLIQGETGTGKTILAKYVHDSSRRRKNIFFSINCATIPETLMESELFGYVPNAFTGASPQGKTGLVETAKGGTLFLDEIGELTPGLQAKLLELIENKRFIPVGGREHKTVDIRIVCATNQDLKKLAGTGAFREDLFWRLSAVEVTIPPLRERREDILPMAEYFLSFFNKRYHTDKYFTADVQKTIDECKWPGNIRQLRNCVERALLTSETSAIGTDSISGIITEELDFEQFWDDHSSFDEMKNKFEENMIRNLYRKYRTSRKLAEATGLSQSTASRLIRKYCGGDK